MLTKDEAIQAMKGGNLIKFEDGNYCSPRKFWSTRSSTDWMIDWRVLGGE